MTNSFGGADVIQEKNAKSLLYRFTTDVARIDREIVSQLVEESARNGNRNAQICLHTSLTANFHEMIVLGYQGHYCRPHKHTRKCESCHIIKGEVAMFVFNDDGSVAHCWVVGGDANLICRVGINQWHAIIPITKYAIYHESKPGPFLGEADSLHPDWAPDESDLVRARVYVEQLLNVARG